MKFTKIFLFSFIFIFASFLAVGFYAFSPSVSYGLTPSGNFDIGTNCVIAPMQSTCVPHLEWSVNNSSVTPKITATINGVVNTQITTGISGPFDDSNHTLNYSSRYYSLYHDNTLLDSVMIDSNCASGTHWNGSLCSPGYVGISTICNKDLVKFPDNPEYCIPANISLTCEIPINGSSCDVYTGFNWTTTNPQIPVPADQANVQFSLVARGGATLMSGTGYQNLVDAWGAWIVRIKHNMYGPRSQAFDATYDTKLLESATAWSYCAPGSTWDGEKCYPASLTVADCMIGLNQSTCSTNVDVSLVVNPNIDRTVNIDQSCFWYSKDLTSIKNSSGNIVAVLNGYQKYCRETLKNIVGSWKESGLNDFSPDINDALKTMGYYQSQDNAHFPHYPIKFYKTFNNIIDINFGQNSLSLYNNFSESYDESGWSTSGSHPLGLYEMATDLANGTCIYGTRWDDTAKKCLLPADTFTITPCEIQLGQSFCEANVTWNVQERAPEGITSLTISSPPDAPKILSSASGTERFYPSGAVDDNTVITLKHNDVILASSSVGYAHCVAGTIWNFNNGGNMCLLDITPMEGSITATPCVIGRGDSTCQTTLQWRVWKNLAWGGEEALPNDSTKMPTITLYENNGLVSVGSSNGTADLITKGTNQYGDFMFDVGTMSLGGLTSFSGSTAKYTLPDVGIDVSYEHPVGVVNPAKIKTRSATFRLGVKYDILEHQITNTYDADLGSVTVNAVCATGSEWNDVTNTCMALCASGFTRSLSTNQCVPLTVTAVLKYSDNTAIQTGTNWFSKFVGNIVERLSANRTTPVINSGTQVKIEPILSEGFNIDNTVCTLIQNGINGNDEILYTWPKGIFLPYPIFPTNTIKYSITCNDQ